MRILVVSGQEVDEEVMLEKNEDREIFGHIKDFFLVLSHHLTVKVQFRGIKG